MITIKEEEKQLSILNLVAEVLNQIQLELKRTNSITDVLVDTDEMGDMVLEYKSIYIKYKTQDSLLVQYHKIQKLLLPYSRKLNVNYSVVENKMKNIKQHIESVDITRTVNSIEATYNNILLDSFNSYMKELSINYRVSHINKIDWLLVCERVSMLPIPMLVQFKNHIDWTIISQYGKFDYNDFCDNIEFGYINERLFILYNQNFSVKLKQELIAVWNEYDETKVSWLTEQLIADRNEKGVAIDNTLLYCIENDILLDYDLLSEKYPLNEYQITKYLDKWSIDKLRKNNNVDWNAIFVLVSKK
jgi:hypothetical protein